MQLHAKLSALTLLSSVFFILSWHPIGLFPLIFVAFVPLFYSFYLAIQQQLNTAWIMLYAFTTFLLFNIGVTWWVWNASAEGAIMAFVLNALLMLLPFLFAYKLGVKQQNPTRLWPFIFAWISFEFLHYRWDGTWTWLTLGNVFASAPWLVQWYELTGVLGGSLWILWVNKSIFQWLVNYTDRSKQMRFKSGFNLVFFKLFAPAFLSLYLLGQYQKSMANNPNRVSLNVMVVQPNIDPYLEKFSTLSPVEQTRKMIAVAEAHIDTTIELVLFPETALVGHLNERDLANEETLLMIRAFMQKHPHTMVLTGADSYKEYLTNEKPSSTARSFDNGVKYDVFNTAFFLKSSEAEAEVYHKSKLVPGVERLPFASVLKYVEQFAIDLGGTTGSLGVDPEPTVFSSNAMTKIAPVICYESIFGEYLTDYVKKGATLIGIITNDGWWGNTPGYKQHLAYAKLRAIETRRYIARSANTGISGFIDDCGATLGQTDWWKADALKQQVYLNTAQTYYVKHGDYFGHIALIGLLYFAAGLLFGFRTLTFIS